MHPRHTVSVHNFKSQNFKLSISNPKGKHVAYLPVLSQILNCQGLGRKSKFEILKTDRNAQEKPLLVPRVNDFDTMLPTPKFLGSQLSVPETILASCPSE